MRKVIVFIIILALFYISENIYPMGNKHINKKEIYNYQGVDYLKDYVYWDRTVWIREQTFVLDNTYENTPEEVSEIKEYANIFDEGNIAVTYIEDSNIYKKNNERHDLTYYCIGLHQDGTIGVISYRRKDENKIYVTDKFEKIEKPYIKLGTFTAGGRVPANWKKVKSEIQPMASNMGADAVVVEKAETLDFKKEDYLPVTKFQHPQYALYTCVAVVYEDKAYIPDYLKVFVTDDDFYFPYEEIEKFTIDLLNNEWHHLLIDDLKKKVYEKYKPNAPDAVRIIKREELSKGGLFSKGMTRYHCIAIRFDDKIKQQFVVYPDTDIKKLMKTKVKY